MKTTLDGYTCIDPNKAFVIDADEDAPLVEIRFCNELRDFSQEEKLTIVEGIIKSIAKLRPDES